MSLVLLLLCLLLALALFSRVGRAVIEHRYPPLGQFIDLDGTRLHYVMAGEGPAILLLHGASSNLQDLASSLLPELAKTHRVIAFDRPGHGYSDRLPGDWADPVRVADVLLTAAERLGARHPLMVGHSWSGALVMAALVEHGDRIRGGVLVSGLAGHWAGSVGWTYDAGSLPLLGRLFAWTAVYPVGRRLLPSAVTHILSPDPVPEGYAERIAAPLALRPRPFLHNVEDVTRVNPFMQQLSPRYDRIDRPLLMIHGESDTIVPWLNHGRRVLPVVPHAEVVMIPGAGHAPHHAHPAAVLDALSDFSRRTPPP